MLSAQAAIGRARRDMVLGTALKIVLGVVAVWGLVAGSPQVCLLIMIGVVATVMVSGVSSARGSRLAAESPSLIAAGEFGEAERRIDRALRTFSMYRQVKLQCLHYLAVLRHSEHKWQESALLCRALIGSRVGRSSGISRPSRLILADALLEMRDLPGTYRAISDLYRQKLSLLELLSLLTVQLEYSARISAWEHMLGQVATKIQLAELMSTASAARVQALLALAAARVGRNQLADWLRSRVELLVDVEKLVAERPILAELWPAK